MQADHTGMAYALEYCDFSLGCLSLHGICQPVLFIDFHGILSPGLAVHAQFDLGIGALPNNFTDLIVLEQTFSDRFHLIHVLGLVGTRFQRIVLLPSDAKKCIRATQGVLPNRYFC